MSVFIYGDAETDHLKKRDKALGRAIDKIGPIKRKVNPDLFSALINSIVGQQISTKAQATIWQRMQDKLTIITPESILSCTEPELQSCGMSYRKTSYIRNVAKTVADGILDINGLREESDAEVCRELAKLDGIGIWTAEMLMLFSMQRPDILSYGDLGILRGMRMLYRHKEITRERFEKYRKRYSPYGSVASLYLWAIAGGAMEKLED